ncbi:MAG: lytic transglycosylase domain-containing protein [Alphaproteobacteria bacterium]|nr:lytic transglycosylase domain-containing protein [Alphaproteobacteria bacterium]
MPRFIFRLLSLLLFPFLCLAPAQAAVRAASAQHHATTHRTAPVDASYYRRAFAAIASGNAAQAEAFAARGPDPVLNKVIRSYAMALPGNDYSFDQLDSFIAGNPDWPSLKGIQMIAEQKIPEAATPEQVVKWFTTRDPVTLVGFYRYIGALNRSGQAQTAQRVIRERWIDGDFSGDEQTAFYGRFGVLLDESAMWARTDRLLWKNDNDEARRMMPYLTSTDKAVAAARLALATQQSDAEAWVQRIPSDAQNDPGLLYQRLRWQVKNKNDENADTILLNAPAELGDAKAWWEQRQIMVRRAIERRDLSLAYRLAAAHGQLDPKPLVQAEFLSGWLALRFLNHPDVALQHFQNLYDHASTPITRARGAYWLGRAYEVLGDKNDAEQAYEDAAVFNTAYYGQLALTRLYAEPVLTAKADPPLPQNVRRAFFARDTIRAALRLGDIGEIDRARCFFHAALAKAATRAEYILLTELATQLRRPDWGIQAVKAASQKDMLVENGGFPLISMPVPHPPESAFTHALIRQESMFDPEAGSSVGARGLMQLMPRTAKDVARKIDVRYSEGRLSDPAYNMQLGTAFVSQQIDRFNGSYILALAGYNAGPARAREWIEEFGDPRDPNVDPIDWIELIPINETRNYVQRIIESLQVYRAKLAGGKARLLIINDLRR